jgi:hypothetical protein
MAHASTANEPQVNAPPERFNAAAHLLALNAGRGARLAYIDDTQRLSYACAAAPPACSRSACVPKSAC